MKYLILLLLLTFWSCSDTCQKQVEILERINTLEKKPTPTDTIYLQTTLVPPAPPAAKQTTRVVDPGWNHVHTFTLALRGIECTTPSCPYLEKLTY